MPSHLFVSQYTTAYDEVQSIYYALAGGSSGVREWSAAMRAFVADVTQSTPNYRSFIAPGTEHCVLPDPLFYSAEAAGVRLVDWLADVVEDAPVDSVDCDNDCGAPRSDASPGL